MLKWDKFHQSIFGANSTIKWFGTKGIFPISENTNAEIVITDSKIHNHFREYLVRIVSKQTGQISAHTFSFDDYLIPMYRIQQNEHFEVIAGTQIGIDAQWYIKRPSLGSTCELAVTIMKYIDTWR